MTVDDVADFFFEAEDDVMLMGEAAVISVSCDGRFLLLLLPLLLQQDARWPKRL